VEAQQCVKLSFTNRSTGLPDTRHPACLTQTIHAQKQGRATAPDPTLPDLVAADILRSRAVLRQPGGHSEGPPPDPIPNSAVKPFSADGTASQGVGE
jgi:hypothetical protein